MWTIALGLLTAAVAGEDTVSRAIRYRVDIPAPIQTVWSAWTDTARIAEWFSRGSSIELRPLGKYDILFDPEAPPGLRGAENNFVLAVQAPVLLSFTWDAPPNLPEARKQRTSVAVRFEKVSLNETRVWFEQTGFGRGGEWDKAYQYFQAAWKSVLGLLHYRYDVGPVIWTEPLKTDVLEAHSRSVEAW